MGKGKDKKSPRPANIAPSIQEIPKAFYPDWSSYMHGYYGAMPPPFFPPFVPHPNTHHYPWGGQVIKFGLTFFCSGTSCIHSRSHVANCSNRWPDCFYCQFLTLLHSTLEVQDMWNRLQSPPQIQDNVILLKVELRINQMRGMSLIKNRILVDSKRNM